MLGAVSRAEDALWAVAARRVSPRRRAVSKAAEAGALEQVLLDACAGHGGAAPAAPAPAAAPDA